MAATKAKNGTKKKGTKKPVASKTTYMPLATCGQSGTVLPRLKDSKHSTLQPKGLALSLPLPPDVDSLVERGSTVSASSYTLSQATPQSSIDTPQTGGAPPQETKKSKPSGTAKAGPKRKVAPMKQQQDEVLSDKQLMKIGLRQEKEAKKAAMRAAPPVWEALMPAEPPASPRRRLKQQPVPVTSKDAEMALLLGLAGMKPKPRSFALVDEKEFVAAAPSAPPLVG